MAAAIVLDGMVPTVRDVDGRVRTKHAERSRVRAGVGGAFGSRREEEKRAREEGRLDEREKSELQYFWGGFESALGCRSSQHALAEHLLRRPPKDDRIVKDAIEAELLRHGTNGHERDRVVGLLADEGVATRSEIRRTMRGMMGAGQLEYFKASKERDRRHQLGDVTMLSGPEQSETLSGQPIKREKQRAEKEIVMVEMVRLVQRADRTIPPAVPREEKWRRADAELEASWRRIECSESSRTGGSRLPPPVPRGRVEKAIRSLRWLAASDRASAKVLEAAYGTGGTAKWRDVWESDEVARLAATTPSVERARVELVRARSTVVNRATVDRAIVAADALAHVLDAQPEEEPERGRWKIAREAFIAKVRAEAEAILRVAVENYRRFRDA